MLEIASDPEVQELTAETQALVALSGAYAVATAESYSHAGEDLKRIKGAKARLETIRKTMTKPLDDAKKAIMDFFRGPSDQLDRSEASIKRAMIAFADEQDRIRREEQRKAEEAARKERERIEAQARKAAESGKAGKAEMLQERAANVVAPVIHREAPKVIGVSTREVWKFEITDPAALPREYTMPDDTKIRKVVGALKGETQIAGVRVWAEKQLAAGTA